MSGWISYGNFRAVKRNLWRKPEGATHHYFIFAGPHKISNFINANTKQYWDGVLGRWVEWGGCFDDSMRLLSDIKLIIELMEERNGLKHKVGYVIEQPHSKDNYDLGA